MKDFEYAKNKQTQKRKKWWVIKGKQYSYYIWALPLIPFVTLANKYKDWSYSRRVWSDGKATKILDYVLPYVLEYVEEDDAYYYCMQWYTTSLWRRAPYFSRGWAKKFSSKLHSFIEEGYNKDGYIKTVEKDFYETWIKFQKRGLQTE